MIDEVVLVAGKGQIPYCRREIVEKYGFQKVKAIVEGGAERYHSVWEGLRVLEKENKKGGYVFIHDGARPFINEEYWNVPMRRFVKAVPAWWGCR